MPALMCTTVPPAKSIAPFLKTQPASALTSSSLACAAALAAASPAAARALTASAIASRPAQHREHVLGTDEATVEQRESRNRHQQHEHRRCQHPGIVALVNGWLRIGSGRGEQADCEGRQSRAIGTVERHLVYS